MKEEELNGWDWPLVASLFFPRGFRVIRLRVTERPDKTAKAPAANIRLQKKRRR
jgi:hypothetical protein